MGRAAETKAAVQEALKRFPTLNIESFVNEPGTSAFSRQRHVEAMRLAGFPACATPNQLKGLTDPFRLPECTAQAKPW